MAQICILAHFMLQISNVVRGGMGADRKVVRGRFIGIWLHAAVVFNIKLSIFHCYELNLYSNGND
jgi:hypothetical protein